MRIQPINNFSNVKLNKVKPNINKPLPKMQNIISPIKEKAHAVGNTASTIIFLLKIASYIVGTLGLLYVHGRILRHKENIEAKKQGKQIK